MMKDENLMRPDDLAGEYLGLLLKGDRYGAGRLIMEAVEKGIPVRDIYLNVFQPSQHEVGRLWQHNEINVAQEHYCTAATQMIMSQLYPYIFSTEKNGRRLVATCVGGELHELGMRMVSDFFEMEGWDTYFLGANMPVESVISTIQELEPDLLAISTSMTFHISRTREFIAQIRDALGDRSIPILVGGRPFNVAPDLWRQVKADGYAADAEHALKTVDELLLQAGG